MPQNNLVVGYFLIAVKCIVILSMFRKIHCNLQATAHEEMGDFSGTLQSNNFRVDQSPDL